MTQLWAVLRGSATTFSRTNGTDLAAEGIDPGDDSEMIDRLPDEFETFDWTTRAYAYKSYSAVGEAILTKLLAWREARLLKWYGVAHAKDANKPGEAYLTSLNIEEARSYQALTTAERAQLVTDSTEEQYYPLLKQQQALDHSTDLITTANNITFAFDTAKESTVADMAWYHAIRADVLAATTAEDALAAADLGNWPA